MQKIISLFQRNYEGDRLVRDEVVPGAEWVQAGEGVATLKVDGTSCMIRDGVLYKRYDAKNGKKPPANFEPSQDPDPVTGHWPGWIPVRHDDPSSKWHCDALLPDSPYNCGLLDGTYELVGPKFQSNPHDLEQHLFINHNSTGELDAPRTFDALKEWFEENVIEGIVWHHPDGRMVKIKRRDFGLPWPVKRDT